MFLIALITLQAILLVGSTFLCSSYFKFKQNEIKNLVKPCAHQFEVIRDVQVYSNPKGELPLGNKYTLKCKHCGILETYKNF